MQSIEAIVPVSNVGFVVTCSELMFLDVLLTVRVYQFGMTMLTTLFEVKAFEQSICRRQGSVTVC